MVKRLAAHNRRKREEKKREEQAQAQAQVESGVKQYYGIGAMLAVGVIGGLGYYIYRIKKGEVTMPHNSTVSQQQQPDRAVQPPRPQNNKFEMD